VHLRLGLGDLARLHHPVDQGVIRGELAEHAVAEQIRSRVADVSDQGAASIDASRREGRPHPGEPFVLDGAVPDRAVGSTNVVGERPFGGELPHRLQGHL
jgi:hypothetical protein